MAERNIPPDVVERAAAAGASDIIIEDGGFNEPRTDGHTEPSATAAAAAAGALAEAPASGALARVSSVTLQVTVNTNYGEEVYICGSDPAIGNWLPADGVKLSTSAEIYPDWFVTLPLPLASRPVRYKYVIKMAADMFTWENRIPDRELIADAEEIFLNDGRFNQIQRQVTVLRAQSHATRRGSPHGSVTCGAWKQVTFQKMGSPPVGRDPASRTRSTMLRSSDVGGTQVPLPPFAPRGLRATAAAALPCTAVARSCYDMSTRSPLNLNLTADRLQAMQEHQVAAARKQQLNDQIAELQRYRAVDAAELSALKARQGAPGAPGGADRAMADLKVAQEQMAQLEAARAEARPSPLFPSY